jgi:hypothetical protein
MHYSTDPVDTQIQQYIDRLKRQYEGYPIRNFIIGEEFTLESNRVFLPEHKDKKYLDYYMACLDDRTALTGSEGEPEMYAVIRSGSIVKILEIIDTIARSETEIFYQQIEEEKTQSFNLFKIFNEGTRFRFNVPLKLRFLKIQVIDCVVKPITTIYDPVGLSMEFEGAKAEAPDYTGGFIEDNGVVGYVFIDATRDDFSYTLDEKDDEKDDDDDDKDDDDDAK